MPLLSSGRHVAVGTINLAEHVKFGTDAQGLYFIGAYQLEIAQPRDLYKLLPVVYFDLDKGTPPNVPRYAAGFSVRDTLDGKADWTEAEIADFAHWLENDPGVSKRLQATFDEVHEAIVASPIWNSELVTDEPKHGLPN